MNPVLRVHPMVLGNTMKSHRLFMDSLRSTIKLHEVLSQKDCDVIIAFVPIVSRAGTDIQAALEKLPKHSHNILVALHHTFDPDYIAPDSRHSVHRGDVFAVDCLYHEDQGLLNSRVNDEALKRVIHHLGGEKSSNQVSDHTELISWVFAVLSFFLLYFLLSKEYSFFYLLVCEIFLIVIIAFTLGFFSHSKWTVWVVTVINIAFIFKCFLTNQHDLQISSESPAT